MDIKENINKQIEFFKQLAQPDLLDKINDAANLITETLVNDGRIILASNFECSFLMQHFQNLLAVKYRYERPMFPAINLMESGNHCAFACSHKKETMIAELLQGLGISQDILLYFSSSNNEEEMQAILEVATEKDIKVILFDNSTLTTDTLQIQVECDNLFYVNNLYLFIFYQVLDLVEYQLFAYEE
jgi:D-sedoheptulose 7-phosphate isomerase